MKVITAIIDHSCSPWQKISYLQVHEHNENRRIESQIRLKKGADPEIYFLWSLLSTNQTDVKLWRRIRFVDKLNRSLKNFDLWSFTSDHLQSYRQIVSTQDGRVIIWTAEGTTGSKWVPKVLHKFDDVVWHVSWSITGDILAVSGGNNKVCWTLLAVFLCLGCLYSELSVIVMFTQPVFSQEYHGPVTSNRLCLITD